MEILPSCTTHKETRVNFDWIGKSTSSPILIPSPSTSLDSHYALAEPEAPTPVDDIEGSFRSAHIASATNIFFRPLNRFPRAILWRIIDDSRTLTLNSVDFTKPSHDGYSGFEQTIKIRFHSPIKGQAVAMADGVDADETVVYVLLTDKTMYTLRLKPEFWRSEMARKRLPDWVRYYSPSTFTLNSPHHLLALDGESCVVSLQNGGLLRLSKNHQWVDADSTMETKYIETSYNNSLMSTFKQFIMPFASSNVAAGTIISLTKWDAQNDEMSEDEPLRYILSVSVNRALKVWSPEYASPLYDGNILGEPKGSPVLNELIESTPRQLVKVVNRQTDTALFYAVTLDPKTNTFKVWRAKKNANQEFSTLVDEYPESVLEPTSPKGDWDIHEFAIEEKKDGKTYNLWILWKRHGHSKIHCHELDFDALVERFDNFTVVSQEKLQEFPDVGAKETTVGSQDVGDFWEDWILYPERFPESVIETVLRIYAKKYPSIQEQAYATGSLASRIASTVVGCHQEPLDDDSMEIDSRSGLAAHWERFARLCVELDRERQVPMKLALDKYSHFLWVVNADGVNSVRDCLELEYILENQELFTQEPERVISQFVETPNTQRKKLSVARAKDVLWLMVGATKLSEVWPAEARTRFRMELQREVLSDVRDSTIDRIEKLLPYIGNIPQEALEELGSILDNAVDVFAAFGRLYYFFCDRGVVDNQAYLTTFGEKVIIKAAQEAVYNDSNLLLDLFALFILLSFKATIPLAKETDHSASAIVTFLDLYFQKVKEFELLQWMAKRKLAESLDEDIVDAELTNVLNELTVSGNTIPSEKKNGPILQLLLQEQMGPAITGNYGANLAPFVRSFMSYLHLTSYDTLTVEIATFLLNFQAFDLAKTFLRFVPTTHWGTYIKGRIYLATDDDEIAAQTFRKAASGLGNKQVQAEIAPGNISPILGEDVRLFGAGFSRYYYHIARLFYKRKAYTHVLDFTQLALEALHISVSPDLPTPTDKTLDLETSLLNTLFSASLKTSTFDSAYLAISRMRSPQTQRTSLTHLVEAMLTQGSASHLLSYSFIGLHPLLEEILTAKAASTTDIRTDPPYHKTLYAWLVKKGDFKGAAAAAYAHLAKLKSAEAGVRDPTKRAITDGQLVLLNALQCLDRDNAWVFGTERSTEGDEVLESGRTVPGGKRVRREGGVTGVESERTVVRTEDVYREYREERERNRVLARGGFYLA